MAEVLVVLGVLVVIADYVIKFLALGVLPNNRKPSSAMAWLILILIIPMAGFLIFLFLGRTNVGKGRIARQREADDAIRAATDKLPTAPVTEPAYLGSMATLNYNLGSLPLQAGNRVELIPGYHDAIAAMTADVAAATETVEVEFYISAWDDVTGPFFEALVAAVARGVKVRLMFDHMGSRGIPGYEEFAEEARRHGHRLAADAPRAPVQGSVPAPRPAQPPQDHGRRRAGRPSWARRTSSSRATTSRRTTRRAASGSSSSPASTDPPSTRCGRSSPRTGTSRATSG